MGLVLFRFFISSCVSFGNFVIGWFKETVHINFKFPWHKAIPPSMWAHGVQGNLANHEPVA